MTYCYPILSVLGVVQRGGTFGHYSIFFKSIWILKKHNLWTAWLRRHFSDKRKCAWFWCTKRLLPKFWIHDPLVRVLVGFFERRIGYILEVNIHEFLLGLLKGKSALLGPVLLRPKFKTAKFMTSWSSFCYSEKKLISHSMNMV